MVQHKTANNKVQVLSKSQHSKTMVPKSVSNSVGHSIIPHCGLEKLQCEGGKKKSAASAIRSPYLQTGCAKHK